MYLLLSCSGHAGNPSLAPGKQRIMGEGGKPVELVSLLPSHISGVMDDSLEAAEKVLCSLEMSGEFVEEARPYFLYLMRFDK